MYAQELLLILVTLFQLMMHLETFSISDNSWKAKHLKGRFTRDVKEYEVTVPSKLSSEGKFVSYFLPHFYKRDIESIRKRRRTDDENDLVHYGLAIGGQEYVVELHPNRGLMSPGLVVENRSGGSLQDTNIHPVSPEQCHYTGWIRGNRNTTRAAISVCQPGMVGYVKTIDGRRHFIEPVADHQPESDGRHLHMVYEDSQQMRHRRNCGTGDDWEPAWRERLMRERRHYLGTERSLKRDVERRLEHVRHVLRHPEEKRTLHSEHRYLEILVVADKRFVEYHNTSDLESYILTIMNMAFDFYHDASVGNLIDFVVVRIMYLEKEEKEIDLIINRDAEATLESFCNWQIKVNPNDISHPNHHDIAVLLTRYDICSDNMTECGLLGLAFTAQACNTNRSCCINEDTGLTLGVVVTHEVGHVLGCAHDEPETSGCEPYSDPDNFFGHVMSPYVQLATNKWSTCSKGFITEFLDNNLGACLVDEPQEHSFKLPNMPPGAMYDIDWQCHQKFGPNSKSCKRGPKETCEKLWCTMGDTEQCGTYGQPPADGTKCGENMWCFERQCVDIGARPAAVNGGWAEWGPYSECSRTCGSGVSLSERDCNNPAPQNHGRYCTGEKKRYLICNTKPCDAEKPSYRASQCAEYDSKPFKDKLHHWKPFDGGPDSVCKLTCCNEQSQCRVLAPRVADSTPCKPGTRAMCIAGVCRKVGCDWVLDSDAVEDQCGICQGDGTQCEIVESTFTQSEGDGYVKIVTIPAGARKIFVEELKPTGNTIAVADETGNTFYLNGDYREQLDGEIRIAGSVSVYTHPEPDKEMLVINGPLKNNINLYVCFFGETNPGVTYRYAIPFKSEKTIGTEAPEISMETIGMEIVILTSAEPEPDEDETENPQENLGLEIPILITSTPESDSNSQTTLPEETIEIPIFTSAMPEFDKISQPKNYEQKVGMDVFGLATSAPASAANSQLKYSQNISRDENTEHESKYSWEFLAWGECSVKCGGGVQMSDPSCVEEHRGRVSNSYCGNLSKPEPMARICSSDPCRTHWKIGAWSHCQECHYHKGCRMRSVKCVKQSPTQDLEVLEDDKECAGKKPETRELCNCVKNCQHNGTHKTTAGKIPTIKTTEATAKLKANEKSTHLSNEREQNSHQKQSNVIHIMEPFGANHNFKDYKNKNSHKYSKLRSSSKINDNVNGISSHRQTSNYNHKSVNQVSLPVRQKNDVGIVALDVSTAEENDHNYAENTHGNLKTHRDILNFVPQHGSENVKHLLDAEFAAYKWKLFNQPVKSSSRYNSRGTYPHQQMYSIDSKFDIQNNQRLHATSMAKKRRIESSLENQGTKIGCRTHLERRMSQGYKEKSLEKRSKSTKLHIRKQNRKRNSKALEITSLKGSHNKPQQTEQQKSYSEQNNSINPRVFLNKRKAKVVSKKHIEFLQRLRGKLTPSAEHQSRYTTNGNNTYPIAEECIEVKEVPKVSINKTDIGKIIKDRVPAQDFQLEKAPMIEETKKLVLSDEATELLGDMIPDIINTNNATYLKGKQTEEVEKHLIHEKKGNKDRKRNGSHTGK